MSKLRQLKCYLGYHKWITIHVQSWEGLHLIMLECDHCNERAVTRGRDMYELRQANG